MSRHSRSDESASRRSRRRAQEEPSIAEWLDTGSYGPYAADSNRGVPEEQPEPPASYPPPSTYDTGTYGQPAAYDTGSYGTGSYGTDDTGYYGQVSSYDQGSYGSHSAEEAPSTLSRDVFSVFRSTYEADAQAAATASPPPGYGAPSTYDSGSYGAPPVEYGTGSYGGFEEAPPTPYLAPPAYEPPPAAYGAPAYEPPAYEPPAYERPAYEPPAYERPAYERPAYERPAYERPAYERPAADRYRSIGGVADPSRPAPGQYGQQSPPVADYARPPVADYAGPPMADYLTRPPLPDPGPPPARRPSTPIPSAARSRKAPKDPPPPPVNRANRLRLRVNPITCDGHGICAELLPELVSLDDWGYPMPVVAEVPAELEGHAQRAAQQCPTLAIILERRQPRP